MARQLPCLRFGSFILIQPVVIEDHVESHPGWNSALLTYFNPGGAHLSGNMGEDPQGVPYNFLALLWQIAARRPGTLRSSQQVSYFRSGHS